MSEKKFEESLAENNEVESEDLEKKPHSEKDNEPEIAEKGTDHKEDECEKELQAEKEKAESLTKEIEELSSSIDPENMLEKSKDLIKGIAGKAKKIKEVLDKAGMLTVAAGTGLVASGTAWVAVEKLYESAAIGFNTAENVRLVAVALSGVSMLMAMYDNYRRLEDKKREQY